MSKRVLSLPAPHLALRRHMAGTATLMLAAAIAWMAPAPAKAGPFSRDTLEVPTAPEFADTSDRLIVKYRGRATGNRRSALNASRDTHSSLHMAGVYAVSTHVNAQGAQVIRLDRHVAVGDLQQLAQQVMANDPTVLYAEPDRILKVQSTPADPMFAQQWDYFETKAGMNLPLAWDLSTGSGVVVAVLDTGYRPHADLADNLLTGYDFVSDAGMGHDGDGRDADASDPGDGCSSGHSSWHGTHVAGTIAALANNGIGIAGVAYSAKVLPVRVLGCGGGYNSDIADGMIWAAGGSVNGVPTNATPAKVLNLSLGGQSACSMTMQSAINTARSLGANVVVAAGNANMAVGNFSPANCKGVIAVAALGRNGGKAPYSNYGGLVTVAAPGGNMNSGTANGILSTLNTGGATPGEDSYAYYQGTSMAAPHVAGVVALMLARNPQLTPDEVTVLLRSTTRPFPAACGGCGTGMVDAAKAVKAVFMSTSAVDELTEAEPNNTQATAQLIEGRQAKVRGSFASTTDVDMYKVNVAVGATLAVRLLPNASSDHNLALRNAAGVTLASAARGVGLSDALTWTNKGKLAATVFLRITRVSGGVGDAGAYSLEVAR